MRKLAKYMVAVGACLAVMGGVAHAGRHDWRYDPPTHTSLHVVYPSWVGQNPGNANHANIRFENVDTGATRTLNWHTGSRRGFYPEHTFVFADHRQWPNWSNYCVVWVQVAETNYHWSGRVCSPPPTTTTTTTTTVPQTTTTTTTTTIPVTTTTTIPVTTTTTIPVTTTTTIPVTTTTVPETTTTTVPETTTTVPQTTVPETTTTVPQTTVPETTTTVPETTTTAPETTVPETTTTVPETTTTAPETTVPETTTTVPETTTTVPEPPTPELPKAGVGLRLAVMGGVLMAVGFVITAATRRKESE
jgi:hypothetical protein